MKFKLLAAVLCSLLVATASAQRQPPEPASTAVSTCAVVNAALQCSLQLNVALDSLLPVTVAPVVVAPTPPASSPVVPPAVVVAPVPAPVVAGCPAASASFNSSETYVKKFSTNVTGNGTYVVKINVDSKTTGLAATLSWAEAPGEQRTGKKVSISRTPCDFTASPTAYVLTPSRYMTSSTRQIYLQAPGAVSLGAGTWYLNINNPNCVGKCNSLFEWLN